MSNVCRRGMKNRDDHNTIPNSEIHRCPASLSHSMYVPVQACRRYLLKPRNVPRSAAVKCSRQVQPSSAAARCRSVQY